MAIPLKILLGISIALPWASKRLAPAYLIAGSVWKSAIIMQLLLTFLALVLKTLIYPKFFSPLRNLPQPSGGSWLHGQFYEVFAKRTGLPHWEWLSTVPNDGLIYYTSWMNSPRVFVTSPETLREVLTQKSYEFEKPGMIRKNMGKILGVGILLAEGDEHHRQRRNLLPAFQYRHIRDLYTVFWDKSRELILALDKAISAPSGSEEKPSRVIEVGKWASRSTLDMIGAAGMGKSFDAIADENNELYQTYQSIFSPNKTARILGMLGLVLPTWFVANIPVKRNNDMYAASGLIKQTCRNMIRDKNEKLSTGQDSGVDILSVAIKSGGFSEEDLVNQMMTFLVAGHETTASSLTWALCYLCQHPHVQTSLRSELQRSDLPSPRNPNTTLTAENLDAAQYPYLHAVCSEVLRFQPPVPLTFRAAAQDAFIGTQLIPKETTIVISPFAINQSKALWGDDADVFRPQRWLDFPSNIDTDAKDEKDISRAKLNNHGSASSNYAMLTFLHGPRSCIGQGFGRAEFACLLAAWVSAFEIDFEHEGQEVEVQGGITTRVKGGLMVRLTPIWKGGDRETKKR